jgi:hypothetical protein
MRYVIRLAVLFCCTFAGLQVTPAHAEKRVALVIGNGSYAHIAHLPNVPNDATAMASLFKEAKFDAVDVKQDLGVAELRRALREFAGLAADADVAVLFYAGHGIEVGQVSYLIPVDARLVTDYDVEDEAVPLDRVLQAMEPAKRLRLVLLDACRENPFVKSMRRTAAARSVGRGLGRVEPATSDTLIAYATKANAIADDGKGQNSPFTAALVKHLLTPGLDLRIALGHVRDEVRASTAKKQEPYVTGSLGGGVVSLAAPPLSKPDVVAPPLQSSDGERAWVAAKDSTSIPVLEAFRRQYGASNTLYDRLAEARIEELNRLVVPKVQDLDGRRKFDGAWTVTWYPESGCGRPSDAYSIRIQGGTVTGETPPTSGKVSPTGAAQWTIITQAGKIAKYSGTFADASGSGRFEQSSCKGRFIAMRHPPASPTR